MPTCINLQSKKPEDDFRLQDVQYNTFTTMFRSEIEPVTIQLIELAQQMRDVVGPITRDFWDVGLTEGQYGWKVLDEELCYLLADYDWPGRNPHKVESFLNYCMEEEITGNNWSIGGFLQRCHHDVCLAKDLVEVTASWDEKQKLTNILEHLHITAESCRDLEAAITAPTTPRQLVLPFDLAA